MESMGNSRLTKYTPGHPGMPPLGGLKSSGRPGSGGGDGIVEKVELTKGSTPILRYPLAVDTADDQGHYMIFEVMQTDPAKLVSRKMVAGAAESYNKAKTEHNTLLADIVMDFPDLGGMYDAAGKLGTTTKNNFVANIGEFYHPKVINRV